MKRYDYLIAYNFTKEGYLTHCTGTMQVSLVNKVKTFKDVTDLQEFVQKSLGDDVSNVSIYNIIFIGRNKH